MNESDLTALLHETRHELDRLIASYEIPDQRDGLTILGRIRQSFNGWPRGNSFEAGRGKQQRDPEDPDPTALLHADPTGEAGVRRDRASEAYNRLIRRAKQLRSIVDSMAGESAAFTLRSPNVIEQDETYDHDDKGCVSCARVASPGTVGRSKGQRTPWYNRIDLVTKLADGTSVALCDWCWRGPTGVKHTGQLPPTSDVEKHRDGVRVRRSA